ncbi:uncharacterized protein LOC126265265 [Aethina tumida]|uniref:uncharacterized protein LOC126265110 n=1 Tax=Aethina tumida TaxID=116153 RepID=UPI002148EB3E|nr:uncharacterized protein LOC126265110 [Aethina tumida]XP_049821846.1 uncharacterized protein LOC126265242 [Aethina tumida]XP_049821945.1 uncharacterized protein LOC126265258 [Aethina tumida]XP_049822069.1 uncharacterized protein LOC126265265 [Aethina tumida]
MTFPKPDSDILPTSPSEVRGILKALNNRKSPGPDTIPNVALKKLATIQVFCLSKLDARSTEDSSTSHERPSPRSRPHPSPRRHQQNRSHPFQGPSTRLSFHEPGRRRDKRTTDDVEPRRLSGSDLKRCFNCQEVGYISRNCPRSRTNDVCRLCKERGHYAKRCPKRRDVKPRFDLQRINVLQMSVPGYRKWGVTPEGNGLSVYLDTGSECNVISPECVKRIGLQTQPVQATLSGFGGGRTDANRQTQLVVTVDR